MSSDLTFYLEVLKRRLPIMLVIFVLCTGLGISASLTMPPKYRASASLFVEGAQISGNLVTSTVQTEAAKALRAMQLQLLTRDNLIRIANKYSVFAGESGLTPNDVVDEMRRMTNFSISYGNNANPTIMYVTFESGKPKIAADIVNEFVTQLLQADAERRIDDSGQTLEFFEQRVERLTEQLARQSAEILEFKEANKDALPDTLDYRLNRQSTLQDRLNILARDRMTQIEQRNRLEALGTAAGPQNVPMTPQQQEIAQLQSELRRKLAIYAPDSATIKFLRRRIELLESGGPIQGDASAPANSVNSILEVQLASIDARIQSIDDETAAVEKELAELTETIERTPGVAIALEKLDREYVNTQSMYNQAVAARSTAEQGVDVEVSAKGERVVLVEKASVPASPTSPNRKLIAGGGVLAGSGLAALFFVLAELINRSIRRPVDLTRGLGIQPLATIPFLEEESTRRRRRILKIIFMISVLIAVPMGLWAVHNYVMPLDLVVEKVLDKAGL